MKMNRPNKIKFTKDVSNTEVYAYIYKLEKYCDELEKYCDLIELDNKLLHQRDDRLMKINEHLRNDKIDSLILTDEEAMAFTGNGWVSINAYKKKLDEIDKLEHQADVDRLTIDCESATIEQYRKTIDTYENEIINLKQALDKACNKLFDSMVELDSEAMINLEQWRKWALKDE